jgi:hypothetical protein
MGVVIEICGKYPGGPTRIRVTDVLPLCSPSGPSGPLLIVYGSILRVQYAITNQPRLSRGAIEHRRISDLDLVSTPQLSAILYMFL